jgi:hypothetical protein
MAYVAPSTVSDGNALSAANLNAMSDAITALYGISSGPSVAYNVISSASDGGADLVFQYKHQYLLVEYFVENDPADSVDLYITDDVSEKAIMEDGSPAAGTRTVAIDLSTDNAFSVGTDSTATDPYTGTANTKTWTVGKFYRMRIAWDLGTSPTADSITFNYIINSDSTTI